MDVTDDQVHGNQEGAFFNSDVITKAQNDYLKRLEPVSALMEQMFSPDEVSQ